MIGSFFRIIFQLITFALLLSALYQNIYTVPDQYKGLLVEKTEGVQDNFLQPGYHWVWTGFVPEKWKLHLVRTTPDAIRVELHQPLPYSEYLNLPDIFSTEISLNVKYRLNDSSLHYFWDYFHDQIANSDVYILERIKLLVQFEYLEALKRPTDLNGLKKHFQRYFSEQGLFADHWREMFESEKIELVSWELLQVKVPPADIYQMHLGDLRFVASAYRDATVKRILALTELELDRLKGEADIEKAEQFSKLLEKNSNILEYYEIEKLSPDATQIIIDRDKRSTKKTTREKPTKTTTPEKTPQPPADNDRTGTLPPIGR